MKVTKPYKIWSKYNNFNQKSTKYDKINFEKYKFWHFWASFFVFQGKFLSLEFFIWHTLKQQIKTRHLEKIPAQKNHFNSSYDFLYLFFTKNVNFWPFLLWKERNWFFSSANWQCYQLLRVNNHFYHKSKKFFFQNFCLNSVLRPPFPILLVSSTGVHFFHLKHAGSLKKKFPEDSALHRADVKDKRHSVTDAGVVFSAHVLRT